MANKPIRNTPVESCPTRGFRNTTVRWLRGAMEGVVLLLVCLSPWPFGCVHPGFELLLYAGLALLMFLWAAELLLAGRARWQACPVTICLAALFLIGVLQLVSLPKPVLGLLSSGTSRLYDQLFPAQPEVLPAAADGVALPCPGGTTLSLAPSVTREELVRLLAVLLLFTVVRQSLASPAALRRLSIAALINGALLALFALFQFWNAPPNSVYWVYPSIGTVFGPFINRNHFAFYANMCVGLGLGMLFGGHAAECKVSKRRSRPVDDNLSPLGMLQDATCLWIGLGLALILSSVAVGLSRGGFWALVGAAGLCLIVMRPRLPYGRMASAMYLVIVPSLALTAWFGMERVTTRLSTAWNESGSERVEVWLRMLPLVKDFPVMGTGMGTFPHVEPLQRIRAEDDEAVWGHAHNEYVEALVEGGLLRLGLSLAAIGLVFGCGFRAVYRSADRAAGALALGALFSFTTIVLHSVVEFGLHIPAIAVLATVVCGHLCALAESEPEASPTGWGATVPDASGSDLKHALRGAAWNQGSSRPGRVFYISGAVVTVLLGLLLVAEGWRTHRSERLRFVAQQSRWGNDIESLQQRIRWLEAAVRLAPEKAQGHLDLAHAHFDLHDAKRKESTRSVMLAEAAKTVLAFTSAGVCEAGLANMASGMTAAFAPGVVLGEQLARNRTDLWGQYAVPALWHLVRARDASPLLASIHIELAAHANWLERADAAAVYRDRARLLGPADPDVWYRCGRQELASKLPSAARHDFHRSLELSDRNLDGILDVAGKELSPAAILEQIIPDRPTLLFEAANRLFPGEPGEQAPYLAKALRLYEENRSDMTAEELCNVARIHRALDRPDDALAHYRNALTLRPDNKEWRYEYAQLLYRHGHIQNARRELLHIIADQKTHSQADDLLGEVSRALAAGVDRQ